MLYISNGTDISLNHKFQIAYGDDGTTWSYLTKSKIKTLQAHVSFVRLIFEDGSIFNIDLNNLADPPSGWTPTPSGVQTALNDISTWIQNG